MNVSELTITLPATEAAFLQGFAKRHKTTISNLIDHYIKQLQLLEKYEYHPDTKKFAGILPSDIDAWDVYYEHLERKHQ
jgi:hypothetical protein